MQMTEKMNIHAKQQFQRRQKIATKWLEWKLLMVRSLNN